MSAATVEATVEPAPERKATPTLAEAEATAMQLPLEERLTLADRLIDSGAPRTPKGEEGLSSVLARRLREVETGEVELIPWEEHQQRVEEALQEAREERAAR
jgi:putative addiction module component (TIGR02574 family)